MSNNSNEVDQSVYFGVLLTVTVIHIFLVPDRKLFVVFHFGNLTIHIGNIKAYRQALQVQS